MLAIALGVFVLGVGSAVVGYLFVSTGSSAKGKVMACVPDRANMDRNPCPPKKAPYIDGLVQRTSSSTMTIQPMRGPRAGATVKLYVRKPDRPWIDIQHAQSHAALGQPIRVYTRRVGKQDVVIYLVDSPVLF